MTNFAQWFVFWAVTLGLGALVAGVVLGAVSLGFAWITLATFGAALYVLWDHARDA